MEKRTIIDEEGTEICYLTIPFNKIKMDSDVEPKCGNCDKPLLKGNIVYISEKISCDLCSNCFKKLQKQEVKTKSLLKRIMLNYQKEYMKDARRK